ncbi:MAG TPA: toll/interleukin-1 receptor domain-containing protein, partial [Pedobacter sp.]|nr:toll/interleukin-1 receptor domain-containing protein [Pedobacter sp.]
MVSQKRVYLSYSFNDKQKVDLLRQYLIANGFELVNDSDILPGESWKEVLMNHLKTSDYILICLTKKMFRDGVFRFEYEREFFETAKRKDIITIPLLMEDLEVPLQFKQFDVLDFREFTQDNLARLVRSMRSMDEISFDRLDAQQFEG